MELVDSIRQIYKLKLLAILEYKSVVQMMT